jgi:hypothetical protein
MHTSKANLFQVNHPVDIIGRGISSRHLSDAQRAALAVELMNGTIRLERLSLQQAAAVTGASVAGVFRAKYRNGNGAAGNGGG